MVEQYFERGAQLRARAESAIFETVPLHEAETGLYVTPDQLWEVDGYIDDPGLYILICRKAGIALKLTIEDINNLFEEVSA